MTAFTLQLDELHDTAELVRASQAGDREAFGQLFERFQPVVIAIAMRRVRDYAEAQELSQDVFVQAMLKIDQLRTPEAFAGWIRQITVRMAINRVVRRVECTSLDPDSLLAQDAAEGSPLESILELERQSQVRAGLNRLGYLDRETLIAFYVDGKSLLEMAEDFDAPLGTIKRRLHVARKRLAREVEELAVA
jgi:RNA polymerase sigma-70 factor, ECF subfamily